MAMMLTPAIICREALRLFAMRRSDPGFSHPIVGSWPEQPYIDIIFDDKDLALSLEDFSHRILVDAIDWFAKAVPYGEFFRLQTDHCGNEVACETWRGIWIRYTRTIQILEPGCPKIARFEVLVAPDEWSISG